MARLIGRPWQMLDTPALLVDVERLDRNLAAIAALALDNGVALRPHVKTHKSLAIAARQRDAGVVGFTVAKLDEAEVLIKAGFDDLLVAYELVAPAKIDRALRLGRRARIQLAVDSAAGADAIAAAALRHGVVVEVQIEIDCGLRRCGVLPAEAGALAERIRRLEALRLSGIFTHAGHAYAAPNAAELERVAVAEAAAAREAAERVRAIGLEVASVSVGATPTVRRVVREPGITEIRPGNYVFNDGIQLALGVASEDECALTVAATVISRPTPERAVIDAGSKTLGLDRGAHGTALVPHYGSLIGTTGQLVRLSEEHGILELPAASPLAAGDVVRVLPNHACSVSNLARRFLVVRDGSIVDEWPIEAAGGVH